MQAALGPEERLLGALRGVDLRGPALWSATNRRLLLISREAVEQPVVDLTWCCIACVELRADPFGTMLRVRAAGRQAVLGAVDTFAGERFAGLLRTRAGLGDAAPWSLPPSFLSSSGRAPQAAEAS